MKAANAATLSDYVTRGLRRRKIVDALARGLLVGCAVVALVPLFSVLVYVTSRGLPALDLDFFRQLPKPPVGEERGGMANALLGTAILVTMASVIGVSLGIVTGVFLSEYGTGRIAGAVRFACDMLSSVPSIVVGFFVFTLIVVPMHGASAMAGAIALSIMMIPIVARSSEELLRLVPQHIREAGLALGLPRWKVTLFIVLRGSRSAIVTGVMLAVARIAGETAPLVFTVGENRSWPSGILQPIASLPVQIYQYAISPFPASHSLAWAAALVLVLFVFLLNIGSRFVLSLEAGTWKRWALLAVPKGLTKGMKP